MIKTTFDYACDVEECDSTYQTKEVLGMGIGGAPPGWADLRWTTAAKPSTSDPRHRFMRAVRRMNEKLPPEMAELQDAGADLFVGELQPRFVSCHALICNKCLDKINLGNFQASDSTM